MAATNQDLKDFFALSGNNRALTNVMLTQLSTWFTAHTGIESPTPDDFIDYVFNTFEQQVKSHKRSTLNPTWG